MVKVSICSRVDRPTRAPSDRDLRMDSAFITTTRVQHTIRGGGGMTRRTVWGSSAVRTSTTTGSGEMVRRRARGSCLIGP
jgi:hypothetical protein